MTEINTHNLECDFGKHKGILYTRIPVHYLLWMVNENTQCAEIAEAELKRRGTTTPECEISAHAINRASLRCLNIYRMYHLEDEGLHTWLCRMTMEAIENDKKDRKGRFLYTGMKLVIITEGELYPTLKTVMPKN